MFMKKKSKDSKETTKGKNNKKITLLIVSIVILLICAIVLGTCLYFNSDGNLSKKDEKIVKDELILESGEKVPKVDDFALKDDILSSESEIKYTKMSKNDEDDDNYDLRKVTIYLDKDNNEVSKDVAYEDDKLKDDYIEQEIVYSTGTYKVEIKDNEKIYTSKLVVQDTTKPVLTLKPVEVEESTEIKIDDFITSCKDNSREECLYEFVMHNEENDTYEKIDNIDKNIGERDIYIKAKDTSNNEVIEKTTLKVNKKPEEPKPTTSNSGSSNKTTSSGSTTKKPSSNGSSSSKGSSSSSGSTSKPATNSCGSKGYTYSQSVAYAFWGCNGSEPAGGLTSKINDELFGPAGTKELNACKAHFGNNDCSDWVNIIPILDNATGKVVGYYAKFQMEYGDWDNLQIVGTGYMLPGRVIMTSKSY